MKRSVNALKYSTKDLVRSALFQANLRCFHLKLRRVDVSQAGIRSRRVTDIPDEILGAGVGSRLCKVEVSLSINKAIMDKSRLV